MTNEQKWWKRKIEEAIKSGEYSEDQIGDIKDEMTDHLDYYECEEVYANLELNI